MVEPEPEPVKVEAPWEPEPVRQESPYEAKIRQQLRDMGMTDDWTKNRRKLIILTGGIASGKSNVSRDLKEFGVYHTIDADEIAKFLLSRHGGAQRYVREEFGDKYFSQQGDLIRPRFRRLIFGDMEAKQRLENIMMPLISQHILSNWMSYRRHKKENVIVVEAALFTDSTLLTRHPCLQEVWDRAWGIITVTADKDIRLQRVMKRDGVNKKEAQHALNCQRQDATYPADMKAWVVNTNGTREETRKQVLEVWNQIQKG